MADFQTITLSNGKPFKVYSDDQLDSTLRDIEIMGGGESDFNQIQSIIGQPPVDSNNTLANVRNQQTTKVDNTDQIKHLQNLQQQLATQQINSNNKGNINNITKKIASIGVVLKNLGVDEDPPETPQDQLVNSTNPVVREKLQKLLARNELARVLNNVEKLKKGVNTGPIASSFFDSSVQQYDESGKEIPPGFIDSAITTLFPDRTTKIAQLDKALAGFGPFAFEQGGKQLTGSEKETTFKTAGPSLYNDDDLFNKNLDYARKDSIDYINSQIKALSDGFGLPKETLESLMSVALEKKDGVVNPPANVSQGVDQNFLKALQEQMKQGRNNGL